MNIKPFEVYTKQYPSLDAKKQLTEGAFKTVDYPKHDFKYAKAVIDDLFAGKKLPLGKSNQTVDINDFDKDALKRIRDDVTNSTLNDFNNAYQGSLRSIWSKIEKSPYSKSHANEDITGGELAVLVYIDALTSNQDVDDIAKYTPTKRMFTDSKLLDNVVTLVSTNRSWQKSALATAKAIISKIPQAKTYELHYRDKWYNYLRELGNKLGGFDGRLDRWNPSDCFLIKKGTMPPSADNIENIVAYNTYIGKGEDVIGISLKKSDQKAMHGSVSVGTMIKNLKQLNMVMSKYKDVKSTFPVVHKQLKQLQSSKIADLLYCSGINSDIHRRINGENDQEDIKLKNGTFVNSIPNVLQFLIACSNDKDLFIDTVNMCYLWAASRAPTSCSFWKASENGCKFVDVHTAVDFKLNKVVIPLDGSSRVTFNITVDGNDWSLVARAKQESGFPQFVIEHKQLKNASIKPIKQVVL